MKDVTQRLWVEFKKVIKIVDAVVAEGVASDTITVLDKAITDTPETRKLRRDLEEMGIDL